MNRIWNYTIGFLLCAGIYCPEQVMAQTAAAQPPMGWNSYDCFGYSVNEQEVKANADYMARYLKAFGWQYIVVDYLWSFGMPAGNTRIPFQVPIKDSAFVPWLEMDAWGRLLPLPTKFPSAGGGNGFKPLADYIHSEGLLFGIHVMRGIPRQAVWLKTPVKGITGITADMIADTSDTCKWLNHMFGLNMKKKGAQEYLNSLLELYASWGVDFLKVDDISFPFREAEIEGYHQAINRCGRPVILSLSPGPTPRSEAALVAKYANMWRVSDDVWDTWSHILDIMDRAPEWQAVGAPGHWPDLDMLAIGKFSNTSPAFEDRYSRFTEDELYTHMTLWCMFRSPLMIGGNLPQNRDLERQLFTNKEVIAVDQTAQQPRQLYDRDSAVVWYSHVPGSGEIYAAIFNKAAIPQYINFGFAAVGLKGKITVRDLWSQQDRGIFQNSYSQKISSHGAALFKLSSIEN